MFSLYLANIEVANGFFTAGETGVGAAIRALARGAGACIEDVAAGIEDVAAVEVVATDLSKAVEVNGLTGISGFKIFRCSGPSGMAVRPRSFPHGIGDGTELLTPFVSTALWEDPGKTLVLLDPPTRGKCTVISRFNSRTYPVVFFFCSFRTTSTV